MQQESLVYDSFEMKEIREILECTEMLRNMYMVQNVGRKTFEEVDLNDSRSNFSHLRVYIYRFTVSCIRIAVSIR